MEKSGKYSIRDWVVTGALVIFYTVGFIGFELPLSHSLLVKLTPLALMLSVLVLIKYDKGEACRKMLLYLAFVFAGGFFIEVVGVNTGLIFGHYNYGEGLSIKLFDTPLMIGLNWALMVYLSAAVVWSFRRNFLFQVLLSSAIMVAYDVIMEQVAPKMDMWNWAGETIPLQNYLLWATIAVVFHAVRYFIRLEVKNRMALPILIIQSIFFLLIWLI